MKVIFRKLKKYLIAMLFGFACMLNSPFITVQAYSENTRINNEITTLISQGKLPSWHSDYLSNHYYHQLFVKWGEGLKTWTKHEIDSNIGLYSSDSETFNEIISRLSIPVEQITPNKTIGIYFDGTSFKLIWSSEYIPNEFLNLKSIKMNGVTLHQDVFESQCKKINGDNVFEVTQTYGIPTANIQLNMTPIAWLHDCAELGYILNSGVNINTTIFEVEGWTAWIDPFMEPGLDPTGKYTFSCNEKVAFELSKKPVLNGTPVSQLVTHKFIEITEAEAQSIYDVGFGGYKHHVYFNTPLDLDAVYRVDVSYTLANDNKSWWQFWMNKSDEYAVQKSLTGVSTSGGLFSLFDYQGLEQGSYASNEKKTIYYKYKLHLNYNDDNWDIFSSKSYPESGFKRIQKFKILRLNFVYRGEEFDMAVKMDTIEGDTFNIFDRDLILNTESLIWQFKDTAYDISDTIKNQFSDFTSKVGIIGAVVIGVIIVFLIYKIIAGLIVLLKKK